MCFRSSAGQSDRLLSGRSGVRITSGTPKTPPENPVKSRVSGAFSFLRRNSKNEKNTNFHQQILRLLMDKAVVTLLIRSFFNNRGLFANCTYTISCYIIAVQEVVALKEQKYHLYLSDDEYRQTIQSLVRLKNNLISQGRYTDEVDDVLCKVLSAKIRKLKIKYIYM